MTRSVVFFMLCALLALPVLGVAQVQDLDTWIDTDFDGLPDVTHSTTQVNTIDSFAVYVDPTGFPVGTWTNFLYYFQLGPVGTDTTTNFFDSDTADVSVRYVVSGGSFFPEDNFSAPYSFGIGGNGFNVSTAGGPTLLAVISVRAIRATSSPGAACVIPIVDLYNPTYQFCQLGNGANYGVFASGTITSGCFSILTTPSAAEATSWGKVKGLFR